MNVIKTISHAGLTIRIVVDPDPPSPRERDNLGVMYCQHRRHILGDNGAEPPPDDAIKLPLYLYDHSGITMSTKPFNCPWDSGRVGVIYCTPESIVREYGQMNAETVANATQVMEGEVHTYDQFLCGACYGFEILDGDGDVVESLWGIYQDEDPCDPKGYLLKEAMGMAREMAEENGLVEAQTQLAEVWP